MRKKSSREAERKGRTRLGSKKSAMLATSTGILPAKERPARRQLEEPAASSVRTVIYSETNVARSLQRRVFRPRAETTVVALLSQNHLLVLCRAIENDDCTCFSKHGLIKRSPKRQGQSRVSSRERAKEFNKLVFFHRSVEQCLQRVNFRHVGARVN